MIEFESLSIRNFGIFGPKKQVVNFKDRGSVMVVGENNDTRAADSNGSGKTTIFKALCYCLFGETVPPTRSDRIIHIGQTEMELITTFADDTGDKWRVRRTRKGKTGSRGEVSLEHLEGKEWKDYSRRKASDTQQGICDVLEMDWETFRCTVLFGQGDRSRFASPDMNDAARKAVLHRILKTTRYEEARQKCKEVRDRLKEKRSSEDGKIDKLSRKIAKRQTEHTKIDGEIGMLEEILEDGEEQLISKRAEAEEHQKAIDELNKKIEDAYDKSIDDKIEEAEETVAELKEAKRTIADEVRKLASEIDDLSTEGPCPTCGQDRPFDKKRLEGKEAEHAKAVAKKRRKTEAIEEAEEELSELKKGKREIELKVRTISNNRDMIVRMKASVEGQISSIETEMEGAQGKIDDRMPRLEELEEECASLEAEVEDHKKAVAEYDHKIEIADWWFGAFGPKGVPAFAIEQALPMLNAQTNEHLLELTDGDIRVRWTATTPGRTKGVVKEELTANVFIEEHEGVTPSGGQQKKIELATEVALSKIQREEVGCNLILFDEAFEGLDREGRSRVADWINSLPQESRFVVAHDTEMIGSFDAMLRVVKSDKVSKVERL